MRWKLLEGGSPAYQTHRRVSDVQHMSVHSSYSVNIWMNEPIFNSAPPHSLFQSILTFHLPLESIHFPLCLRHCPSHCYLLPGLLCWPPKQSLVMLLSGLFPLSGQGEPLNHTWDHAIPNLKVFRGSPCPQDGVGFTGLCMSLHWLTSLASAITPTPKSCQS